MALLLIAFMKAFLIKLATWWQKKVHSRVATLIATIGTLRIVNCLLIIYVLAQITERVLEREAFAFDKTILLWIHQFSSPLGDRLMVSITSLGDPHLTVPIVCLTIALLWWRRFYQEAKIFMIDCDFIYGNIALALEKTTKKGVSFAMEKMGL